jgi:hypothetical protein
VSRKRREWLKFANRASWTRISGIFFHKVAVCGAYHQVVSAQNGQKWRARSIAAPCRAIHSACGADGVLGLRQCRSYWACSLCRRRGGRRKRRVES